MPTAKQTGYTAEQSLLASAKHYLEEHQNTATGQSEHLRNLIASIETNLSGQSNGGDKPCGPDLFLAAQNAGSVLARIPAFGDSIGTEVSKAELGIALRQLGNALEYHALCRVKAETLETKLTRLADGYERAADAEENESEAESLRLRSQNIRDALKSATS